MRSYLLALLAALTLTSQAKGEDAPRRFYLVCLGAESANHFSASPVANSDIVSIIGNRTDPFDDQINLWIDETAKGRIRMPRTMLPVVGSSEDDWLKFELLEISENEIRGIITVSFFNRPNFRIDRRTLVIDIKGENGEFSGECVQYPPGQ